MEFSILLPWLLEVGEFVVDSILYVARLLTGHRVAPGWVSLVLVLFLVILIFWHGREVNKFRLAVDEVCKNLPIDGRGINNERLIDIEIFFDKFQFESDLKSRLTNSWKEFVETTVKPENETEKLRNTVRPSIFFNREVLGMEHGMWKRVPTLFVSVGLFLTFLGLVAALDQTGQILNKANDSVATSQALQELLVIASAKFVMSLTGLACSIVFTLRFRQVTSRVDKVLHKLCEDIEKSCDFLSTQFLLSQVVDHTKEQTNHLKAFSTELVAQIAKPLTIELPKTIQNTFEPLINEIREGTNQGIENLVGSVSDQLAESINSAIESMNSTIESTRKSFESIVDRLDESAGTMGGRLDEAVTSLAEQIIVMKQEMFESSNLVARTLNDGADDLLHQTNEALQSIRESSAGGAQQIRDSSQAMADAAAALSQTIHSSLAESTEECSRKIREAATVAESDISEITATLRDEVLNPMNTLAKSFEELTSGVKSATDMMGRYVESVDDSVTVVLSTNEGLKDSTKNLTTAIEPVKDAVISIESASQKMGDQIDVASKAMVSGVQETTRHTLETMRSMKEAVIASQTTVGELSVSLESAVTKFVDIIDNYKEIDESLGDAFEEIKNSVKSSIDTFRTFDRELNEHFEKALNRLEGVIATLAPFSPPPQN